MGTVSVSPHLKCDREDCINNHCGGCVGLRNTHFKSGICPFFKTREQSLRESERAYQKLLNEERYDLIEKYKDYYKAVGLYRSDDIDDTNDPELHEMFQKLHAVEETISDSRKNGDSIDSCEDYEVSDSSNNSNSCGSAAAEDDSWS